MNASSKERAWLPALFYSLLALALSAWLLQFNYFITPDGAHYTRVGRSIWAGRGISSNWGEPYLFHPPFYAFLVGLTNVILSAAKDLLVDSSASGLRMTSWDWVELSAHFVSIIAFALTLFPLFFLVRRIYPGQTAHWACLLFATNGFLLAYSNMALSESLFSLLIVTMLLLFHKWILEKDKNIRLAISAGITGGLAYLTRPEGCLFYFVGLICYSLLSGQTIGNKMRAMALSFAAFFLFFFPYVNFIHQHTGCWQLSALAPVHVIRRTLDVTHPGEYLELKKLDAGLTDDKTRLKMDELKEHYRFWDYASQDHFALLRSAVPSLLWRILEICKYFYAGLGLFLIGAGFFNAPWTQSRKKSEFLLAAFLLPFFCHLILMSDFRRMLVVFPILLIWMAHGIENLKPWAQGTFQLSKRGAAAASLITCLFFVAFSGMYLYRTFSNVSLPLEHKAMGLWMKEHIPNIERERVAGEHPYVHFYSGAKYIQIPYVENFSDLLIYLKHQNTRYFIVSEDYETPLIDSYRFLLDETIPLPQGIRRVHIVKGKKKIVLYESF